MTDKLSRWQKALRDLGFCQDVTELIEVRDCRGLHKRRSAELVKLARRNPLYSIYVRYPARKVNLWANARSIISLLNLGVPGYRVDLGEKPAVVEVKVSGHHPLRIMERVRQVLLDSPFRYEGVYEQFERLKSLSNTGGVPPEP